VSLSLTISNLAEVHARLNISSLTTLRFLELEPIRRYDFNAGKKGVAWVMPFLSNLRATNLERVAFRNVKDIIAQAFPCEAIDDMFGEGKYAQLKEVEVEVTSMGGEPAKANYAEVQSRMPKLTAAGLLSLVWRII
jgi:hypothetical protein